MIKNSLQPPVLARWLLTHIAEKEIRESALGDFEEQFRSIAAQKGGVRARYWYWWQCIVSLPSFIADSCYWGLAMIKNYLIIALRNLGKRKSYSIINISGLAIGLACCMAILLYARYELSYDRFHDKAERIYRVARDSEQRGTIRHIATTPIPLAPAIQRSLPEVVEVVRLLPQQHLVRYENKSFIEERFFYADSTFFEVFSFPILAGDPRTALSKPYSIVLTEEMADKYFGREDPIGRTLIVEGGEHYQVTGILRSIPANSHFHFDFLASFVTLGIDETQGWRWRNNNIFYTYLLLAEREPPEILEDKIDALYEESTGKEMSRIGWQIHTVLQPLNRIHLYSNLEWEIEPNGDATTVTILSAIAFFILLLASVNFVSLTTARSTNRMKEVGLRKVLGAYRSNLIKQFLGESVTISLLAFLVALVLLSLALPAFNSLTESQLTLDYRHDTMLLAGFSLLALVVGVIGGIYPAFLMSGFKPILAFQNPHKTGLLAQLFRKGLVVFQFVIAVVLMVGLAIMHRQLQFVKNKRLGFHKEQVIVLPLEDASLLASYESFKSELLKHPQVLQASAAYAMPGEGASQNTFRVEGVPEEARPSMKTLYVDHDFIPTLGIEVTAGRAFQRDFATDATDAFILNEAAVKLLGWDDPIGKKFGWWNREGKVVGVVGDFHFASLHQRIEPLVLLIFPDMFRRIGVRIRPENISETLGYLKSTWESLAPDRPFQYSFLDQNFDRLYKTDERFRQVWSLFTTQALFIACLGLFGLASFATEQRTREITVRKIVGASVASLLLLLSKDFIRLIIVAFVVACPIAYLAMSKWLQSFAYRTDVSLSSFALAGALTLTVTYVTIAYRTIKAARANPVDSLRYE